MLAVLKRLRFPIPIPTLFHTSVAVKLPPEVIIEILHAFEVAERFIYNRVKYTESGMKARANPELLWARSALYNASLVSRRWHRIVTPLLYMQITLANSREVTAFLRVVTERPELIRLVKELILVDWRYPLATGLARMFGAYRDLEPDALLRMREDIPSILKSCVDIEALTINISSSRHTVSDMARQRGLINSNLRHLTIYGFSQHFKGYNLSQLRHLESISFSSFRMSHPLRGFYDFPKMHTVQVAYIICDLYPSAWMQSLGQLPSLRTFAMYENSFPCSLWTNSHPFVQPTVPCPEGLQRLHLVGRDELRIMKLWLREDPFMNLKELTFGPLESEHDFFMSYDIPCPLENLNILIATAPVGHSKYAGMVEVVTNVARWFEWNCQSESIYRALKHVQIALVTRYPAKVDQTSAADRALHPSFQKIHSRCSCLGVSLHITPITTRINDWVFNALNQHNLKCCLTM
ncbi:unnamed protein product [Somion occarium]|uniref:F-box domain-containing protein n=1 Tax=Somion occarium TaxID=3059160 RepID=A0ABP1EBA9_9APHY